MSRWLRLLLLLGVVIIAASGLLSRAFVPAPQVTSAEQQRPLSPAPGRADLPREALDTVAAIRRGGPFRYERDGTVFQNRERRLPQQPRGYYREYTVATPGSSDRGARRIVTGGQPPEVFYYTDDHYATFRRFETPP